MECPLCFYNAEHNILTIYFEKKKIKISDDNLLMAEWDTLNHIDFVMALTSFGYEKISEAEAQKKLEALKNELTETINNLKL